MFIRRSIIVLSAVLVAAGMSTATASAQVVGEREASRRFDTAIRAAEALRELVATDSLDSASLRRWDRVHGRAVQRVFDRAPRVGVPARARGSRCLAVATCHLACNTAASEVLSARESLAFGPDEVEPRVLVTELRVAGRFV